MGQANGAYARMNPLQKMIQSKKTDLPQIMFSSKDPKQGKIEDSEKLLTLLHEQSRYREYINEDVGC